MKFKKTGWAQVSGMRLSITTKIALALILLISFLIATVGTSVFLRDQSLLKKDFQEKGWNIVHTATQFIGSYLQNNDAEFLNSLVKNVSKYQDISYVMVLDTWGRVLAVADERQANSKISTEEIKTITTSNADVMKIRYDERGKPAVMDFSSPVKTSAGVTMGYLRLGVDLSGLNRHTWEITVNIILICLAAIIAGIFLSLLISKRILQKPLLDLTAATEKLATGDFSCKVTVHKQDELGDLATAFNTMTVHLANLIQSVKSSAADINKSAEQIIGQLRTSDRTNDRLSHTFDLIKNGTTEQATTLKQSIELSDQLSGQSKHAMDCILQVLGEVNKTAQAGKAGVNAITKIAASIEESGHYLEDTRNSFIRIESKVLQFSQTVGHFSALLKKNTACTVQVAIQAARSGNEELTRAAEDLNLLSEESSRRVEQMCEELGDVQNISQGAQTDLDSNIKRLEESRNAVKEMSKSFEKVLQSLLQSKTIIEEAASAAHRQSASIEEIKQSQSGIVSELLNSVNKSSTACNDTRLQTESLHDIDSLAKKLMRMVDRLNVLSLQFKV